MQRVPKLRGFKPFWDSATTITTDQVVGLKDVNNETLYTAKLIDSKHTSVRLVLGKKPVATKHAVKLQGASKTAAEAIAKAGGSFEKQERVPRVAKKTLDK